MEFNEKCNTREIYGSAECMKYKNIADNSQTIEIIYIT